MKQVLEPGIRGYGNNRSTLILADSWSGQNSAWVTNFLTSINSGLLMISPRTTGDLQPLDIGFNRQYKIIVKRITERARLEKIIGQLTTRTGIINLQSLVHNQLSSPAYRDIIKYSWRKVDTAFNSSEMTKYPPPNANALQFDRKNNARCGAANCTKGGLLRCSHCGKILCLHHFLERECFHERGNRLPLVKKFYLEKMISWAVYLWLMTTLMTMIYTNLNDFTDLNESKTIDFIFGVFWVL